MKYKLLIAAWLWASTTTADEKFLPVNLDATVAECGVSVFPDHAEAVVVAVYSNNIPGYRAKLSVRRDRVAAAHDCQVWYQDLANAWKETKGKHE